MLKSEKYNSIFNKFIYFFLLFSPFIDALTGIFKKNLDLPFSIGSIIRGLFLVLAFIWLIKNYKNKRILGIFLIYVFLAILYYFGLYKNNLMNEVNNILYIFYLPILMLFFSKYNNEKINDKLILKIYLLYLTLIIVPYIFGIGYNLSDSYVNKEGYFGLFYAGNELSATLVILGVIALNYVNKSNNFLLKIITYAELFVCIFLVGTKTLFIGTIVTLLYFLIKYFMFSRVYKYKKSRKLMFIIPVLFVISLIIIIPRTPMMKNINTTLDYYNIKSFSDLGKIETIDNVIFSNRLSNLSKANKEYMKGEAKTFIYGIGKTGIEKNSVIEIDIFDIFYSIGIFGSMIYILLMLFTIKFNYLDDNYKFAAVMMIIISLLSGHVLIKPMVSIYIAVLYILSKNRVEMEKKRILLVSNMYPGEKYKYYGSFVKNTEEILSNNGFVVDKVVITKQNEKIAKLFSYIYLHVGTILKGMFNNYDYIYVHFISHSSLGGVFVKKTSFNTKLVLNAHGNDIISDYDDNQKNIKRSSRYIKNADKIVCPSKYFKDIIVKNYNVSKDKVYVYPSGGVNTAVFKKIDREEALSEANLPKKYKYIGFVSRIEKDKGYDVFLKAINELRDRKEIKSDEKFIVVGAGSEEDEFNKLVDELNVREYLEVRNMVSQEELINIYNSLDIFVFPTYRRSESLGLVGLEAMACEVLVIASKNYGPTDYVVDNKNGKFFNPKDYKDLADKILEMKKLNNEEKNKMRKKARETAIKYDSKNTKELILNVFKE
ncbi:MAG: O-antigen ligase family protein [Bacilli bacterium]|nr:O-antigen ligase family protein [Bacilli bacterium]